MSLPLTTNLSTCPHGQRGTTTCLYCRQEARAAARHRRTRMMAKVGLMTLAGIGYPLFVPNGTRALFFLIAINFLLLGQVLYMVWAIWLGVKLARSKVAAPATLASPAHQPRRWGR